MSSLTKSSVSTSTTSATVNFRAVTDSGSTLNYRVYCELENGAGTQYYTGTSSTWNNNATVTRSVSFSGLSSSTTYYGFALIQYKQTYESSWSDSSVYCSFNFTTDTPAPSVTGTITASSATSVGFTYSVRLSTSNASSVYMYNHSTGDWTRINYSSYQTSYSATKTNCDSGTTYTLYLYDSLYDTGDILDYDTITTTSAYTYALVMYGNNGTWSGGVTYKTDSATSTSTSYTFYLSNYTQPTRSGYEFKGWYTASSGGTKKTSVTVTSGSQTGYVYAQWTKINTFSLILYGNNGTWSGGTTYITDYAQSTASTYTFSLSGYSQPTRANYYFAGWYSAASGGSQLTSITVTTSGGSVYAHWNPNYYTISTSVSPSGSGTVSGGGSKAYGSSVTLTATASTGYEFSYWYNNSTSTIVSYNASYTFTCSGAASYTAYFVRSTYTYTITYRPNGGTGSAITDSVTGTGQSFNTYLRGSTFTKAYNTQSGWTDGTNTYGLGYLITISGNMTLDATWTHDTTSNFYWFGNDTLDGQKIFTGTLISNLTATAWKSIGTKINQLESLLGDTQTIFTTSMTSGTVFLASYYNEVTQALRRIINNHSLSITAPSDTAKGNRLFYYLFNGAASVKTCLNNIIQWYNTR